jgi:hypothetical protein
VDCAICGSELKKGVMDKVRGTYIKSGKKLRPVCAKCQKVGEDKIKEMLAGKV